MAITGQIVNIGGYIDISYSGTVQEYEIPFDGLYKFEVWGAKGGNANGGNGGYSKGYKILPKGTNLELVCGGVGSSPSANYVMSSTAGYNGGGDARGGGHGATSGGGGATHVSLGNRGILANYAEHQDEVLIVAGGGGGGASGDYGSMVGGTGGGTTGGNVSGRATGGTQTNGGIGNTNGGSFSDATMRNASFGQGGGWNGGNTTEHWFRSYGGGGGWYGGGWGVGNNGEYTVNAAGGGSGYIDGVPEITFKGETYSPETSNGVNSGNGKVKITFVATDDEFQPNHEWNFTYTGNIQQFEIKKSGLYKLEVWGAQGGANKYLTRNGGMGGYSLGYKVLNRGLIYIGCGGKGEDASSTSGAKNVGGYNGGGNGWSGSNSDWGGAGGGGGTHISLTNTQIKDTILSDLLIVAGGGGGSATAQYANPFQGGNGGGTNGGDGTNGAGGASQTSGGIGTFVGTYGKGGEASSVGYAQNPAGGGGGYYGGGAPKEGAAGGGSGFIGNVPTIEFKGISYSSSTTSGSNSGNGKAKITYIAKSFPTIYLGENQIDGGHLGDLDLDTIYLGENELA